MKSILICPGERPEVAALSESAPLSNVLILGKTLIEYWIEHLCTHGAKEICLLATDRPEQVRALVGDGKRWGVHITVSPEIRELTTAEARQRYAADAPMLPAPDDVIVVDHLPGLAEFPLFTSYADWMAALETEIPRAITPDRIGLHEIKPGIWTGLHTQIAPDAELRAPCWIGDDVFVGPEAVIGPNAVVERGSFIERGVEVVESVVEPETFVGEDTELHQSLASGSTLINWKLNSTIKVADAFLLCSLSSKASPFKPVGIASRLAALLALVLSAPFAGCFMLRSLLKRQRVFRPLLAVRPQSAGTLPTTGDTMVYYELHGVRGWMRRWPQLWNVTRGQFAWVGNRPLNPRQAARLTNDFERLWFATRLGLLCLADTESGCDIRDEEARAHASYYAAHANWRLDWKIFLRAVFLFVFGISVSRVRDFCARYLRWERKAF